MTETTPISEAPPAAPAASTDDTLRAAFPSMFPAEPAAEPERSAAPIEPVTAAPAATSTAAEPPAQATPTYLPASHLQVSLPAGASPDVESLTAFDTVARDLGLDGTAAQRLVDLHAEATGRFTGEIDSAWSAQRTEWRAAAERDPEIGGARFEENVALAQATLDRFGGQGFKAAIAELGIGNHPELVRLLVRVGRALPGAAPARGSDPAPQRDADHDAMLRQAFPSMFRK